MAWPGVSQGPWEPAVHPDRPQSPVKQGAVGVRVDKLEVGALAKEVHTSACSSVEKPVPSGLSWESRERSAEPRSQATP